MDEDPLMIAAGVVEQQIRTDRAVREVRNPAIVRLVGQLGSAPKASQALWEEMLRRGFTDGELAQAGIKKDNVRLLKRLG
jgi:hypothetical protein